MNSKILFLVGCIIFAIFKIGFVVSTEWQRVLPVEIDDAMVYSLRSTLPLNCVENECISMKTILSEIYSEARYPDEKYHKKMQEASLLVQYTFMHTFLLNGIHSLNNSWWKSLKSLRYIAILLIVFSILFFYYKATQLQSAGIALLLMSNHFFSSQGLFIPVPSNIAIGFGFLTLALYFYMNRESLKYFLILLLSIICFLFHPFGKVFLLVSFAGISAFYLLKKDYRNLLFPATVLIASTVAILIPYLSTTGTPLDFNLTTENDPVGIFEIFKFNLIGASNNYKFFSLALFFSLAISSLMYLLKNRNKVYSYLLLFWLLATVASLFHLLPSYKAELFNRVAMVYGIIALPILIEVLVTFLRKRLDPEKIIYPALCILSFIVIAKKTPNYFRQIDTRVYRHAYIDPGAFLNETYKIQKNTQVSIIDEIPLFFLLANGNTDIAINYTPMNKEGILNSEYIIALNPISKLLNQSVSKKTLEIANCLNCKIYIHDLNNNSNREILVPSDRYTFSLKKSGRIDQIRKTTDQISRFPWNQNVTIQFKDKLITLNTNNLSSLMPAEINFSQVFYDSRDYVILRK